MKPSEVLSHLQVLFRNKNDRHTEALACFFTHTQQADVFPEKVETPQHGTWYLVEARSDIQPKGLFKTWAIYSRIQPVEEGEEDGQEHNSVRDVVVYDGSVDG
jgi:hypothetical protein